MSTDKQLIRYQLDDGTTILIEGVAGESPDEDKPDVVVSDDDSSVWGGSNDDPFRRIARRRTRGGTAEAEASERFDSALSRLRPAAEKVLDAFRELNTPSEIQLEFGVKFGAKAGAIIASADSEATFKVSLKWQNPKADSDDAQ